jgi:hypothetical protein
MIAFYQQILKHLLIPSKQFLYVLPVLLFLEAPAQEEQRFTDNPGLFLQEIAEMLNQTPNREQQNNARQLMRDLELIWQSDRFSSFDKNSVMQFAELLHLHKARPYPDYYSYFNQLVALGRSSISSASLHSWHKQASTIVSKENLRRLASFYSFTQQFLSKGLLAGDRSMGWYARESSYIFEYDSTFKIRFQQLNLVCASPRDSSVLVNTSGVFVLASGSWFGRGGKLFWTRFGMDPAKVSAELRFYALDVSKSEFTADSVVFRNLNYFSFPVLGNLAEKVTSGPPGSRTSFPQFISYFNKHSIKNVLKNIDYMGGINMSGPNLIGRGDDESLALLNINRKNKVAATIRARTMIINEERIVSDRVNVSLYFENDSIYHPGLRLQYTENSRNLLLTRTERGIQDSPFFSFYHRLNIYVEALYWNIDENQISFRRMEGPGIESHARFESMSIFSHNVFDRLQVIDEIHPFYVIQDYRRQYGNTTEIRVNDLAYFMKKPEEQIITQLLRFASNGFLIYDALNRTAILSDRFDHILQARAGESDYDVIQITSTTTGRLPNAILNLETFELEINGVPEIELSGRKMVEVFPDGQRIKLKNNRDFHFSGLVKAGLFNFHTLESHFVYDSFKISMTHIDSVSFSVRDRKSPVRGDQVQLARISNQLTDLNGTLFINDPDNKSGLKHLPSYPYFQSLDESYVYFEKPSIQNGALKREEFYFVIDQFTIDSLNNYDSQRWKFDGYLVSAGIFPVFRESLVVMDDYSLGFNHTTHREGYDLYGGKGKYFSNIHLSDQGFFGEGRIDYLSSTATSEKFSFYLGAIRGQLASFDMREQRNPVEFPKAKGENLDMHWRTDTNIMTIKAIKPMLMVFDSAQFSGNIQLSPRGMVGSGKLSFADAVLSSEVFDFKRKTVTAARADFRLLTDTHKEEAFLARHYTAHVDFIGKKGVFTHIDAKSELSFPFNQYICTLDEAIWHMDQQLVRLNNNRIRDDYGLDTLNMYQLIDIDLSGSEFTSLHPDQDSLSFFSLEADYDLKDYAIRAKDVKILRVADAAIFPSDGLITIYENARIEPLRYATIIADTLTRLHRISAANIELFSKNSFKGDGFYDYVDAEDNLQTIGFQRIGVENKRTVAVGEIADTLNFMLNPHFGFRGKVQLKSERKMLEFEGGYRINNPCIEDEYGWTAFKALIDPEDIRLPVKKGSLDVDGMRLFTGFYHNLASNEVYSSLQSALKTAGDHEIIGHDGEIWFNQANQSFELVQDKMGTKEVTYSIGMDRCITRGRGRLNFGLQMPFIKMLGIGEMKHLLIPDSVYSNLVLSINFPFDADLLGHFADSVVVANIPGINLTRGNYLDGLRQLLPANEVGIIANDIELYGSPRNVPEPYLNTITITDLKLKWNPETRSFISMGEFGLSNLGRRQLNKRVKGYIEIEKSRSREGFTLYIELGRGQWYYFTYGNGIMQVMSSSQLFNSNLLGIDQPQRIVENRETAESYEYVISTRRRVTDFLRQMQNIEF